MLKRHPVLWFAVLTLLFSFAVYFLPLPAEQKSLLLPVLLTFVPAMVCLPLVFLTEGRQGLGRVFHRVHGARKWILVGAGMGVLMRVAVLVAGTMEGLPIRAEHLTPGTRRVAGCIRLPNS